MDSSSVLFFFSLPSFFFCCCRKKNEPTPVVAPPTRKAKKPKRSKPPKATTAAVVARADEEEEKTKPPKPVNHPVDPPLSSSGGGGDGAAMPERQAAVKKAMKYAWDAYVKYAWGKDELKPVSKSSQNWLDIGLTIVDSLDTLWVMGLKDEFTQARDWIAKEQTFDRNRQVSTFETSIRVFGGLLSAYDLSKDRVFLDRAKDIGDRLAHSMDKSKIGIPTASVHLMTGEGQSPSWTGSRSILSEIGTLQLEYVYLAKALNEPKYAERVLNIFDQVHKAAQAQKLNGLYPVYVGLDDAHLSGHVTLGALGDSFYEYVLKLWKLTDGKVPRLREMYDEMADALAEHMVQKTTPSGLWYFAEIAEATRPTSRNSKMDELACFAGGGMFAYGAQGKTKERDLTIGAEVTSFCHEMWHRMASGIAPEWVQINGNNDFAPGPGGTHYLLRPETIESFFYMWRLTKDPKYRDWGWEAFQAIEKNCRVESGGYSGIRDVTSPTGGSKDDLQQSFFLAETLKYFYLLFSDDSACDLNKIVFNTEAHPLSIFKEDVSEWGHLFAKFDPRVTEK